MNTFNHHHGFHVYIPPENLTAENKLCAQGWAWLSAQPDTEWHIIEGIREWPAAPQKPIAWFEDQKLAALFKMLFG